MIAPRVRFEPGTSAEERRMLSARSGTAAGRTEADFVRPRQNLGQNPGRRARVP